MLAALAENWWAFALRGIFAALFGLGALAFPGLTVLVLVVIFGFYCLVDGFTALVLSFGAEKKSWYILSGSVSLAAGVVTFTQPGITAIVLLMIIGVWALIRGVIDIMTAIELRKVIQNEWLLAFGGLVSILFGLFVIARPGQGALAIIWLIAIFALLLGFVQIAVGFRLKVLKDTAQEIVESVSEAAAGGGAPPAGSDAGGAL